MYTEIHNTSNSRKIFFSLTKSKTDISDWRTPLLHVVFRLLSSCGSDIFNMWLLWSLYLPTQMGKEWET